MIDWGNIKAAVNDLISDLSGLSPSAIRWRDQAEGTAWVEDPAVFLSIDNIVGNGIEEERVTAVGDNNQEVELLGQRQFTLSVQCESFEQDLISPRHAANVIETIKIRFIRSSSIERYRGIFGIRDYMDTKSFKYRNQGRMICAYAFDLLCLTANSDIDRMPNAGNWIGRTLVDSDTIDDVDGVPFIEQIELDINTL
jgi:hypothetical protein